MKKYTDIVERDIMSINVKMLSRCISKMISPHINLSVSVNLPLQALAENHFHLFFIRPFAWFYIPSGCIEHKLNIYIYWYNAIPK